MITKDAVLSKNYEELMRRIDAGIIFLFGSILTPGFHKNSDIDIGVYFENRQYDKTMVYDAILDFFQTEKVDIAFLNEASPLLLYQVVKKGKVVAYKNYMTLIEFKNRCLKRYWETAKFRRMKEHQLKKSLKTIG